MSANIIQFKNTCDSLKHWVGDATPSELRKMPQVLERIQRVQEFRLASKSLGTRKLAERPTHFHAWNQSGTSSAGQFLLVTD
ncbi:type IIL restriction-modification enzyme MmeI [Lapidilactobacillus bayanensis]|uniref:type IIL restriction-modification enzyme MmeI n=1 Tax=Lapidilactobacillus bayanensis TaxID=2485998 RepID=UPI002989B218|nr:type IIL restriction-modification enzyme MmeI [Lapidilactobacillus bayanensis]